MYIYSHTYKYIFKEKDTTDLRVSNGGQGKKKVLLILNILMKVNAFHSSGINYPL